MPTELLRGIDGIARCLAKSRESGSLNGNALELASIRKLEVGEHCDLPGTRRRDRRIERTELATVERLTQLRQRRDLARAREQGFIRLRDLNFALELANALPDAR